MGKSRLEAFSDGVLAIIITIMVLELHTPQGGDLAALLALWPIFLCYVLSFIYVGIYWNNHHHLLHTVTHVSGGILWANLHLLFWLSLVPFVTRWMGENHFTSFSTALYGVVLLMAAVSYIILQNVIMCRQGPNSLLKIAIGTDRKGKCSMLLYALAIPLAFVAGWASGLIYALVALIWLVPDTRIEHILTELPPGD